ncbi:MAG: heterodisulfide reductase-related iron-sulfur binding cluster [Syntrophobacteraceae bacterium]|nr:hypothetical protein [Desulfobacteraceae bacterium]
MRDSTPERMARAVVDGCADCDICRYLMADTPCALFPELYRLCDREAERDGSITAGDLKKLVELCNFCALCPCPNVRADIMRAKHAFVTRDGFAPNIRILEDVERMGKICGVSPRLANTLLQGAHTGVALKRLAGIHRERKIPLLPKENFPAWARGKGLHVRQEGKGRKVALFAGCTGQFLFPEVPKAAVKVLERNGIEVYLPEQRCCGMPSLLEGDQDLTFAFASFNMEHLEAAVDAGYDVVCSCPTCGYMLKSVLSDGALYSAEYRDAVKGGNSSAGTDRSAGEPRISLRRRGNPVLERLYKDDGYFVSLDPLKRIKISRHTYDLGEYLLNLHRTGNLNERLGSVSLRVAYYPPCHLREQKIGEPYADLLGLVPGIAMERIDGAFHCCGISGIMGFKHDFHDVSVAMGSRLMEEIRTIQPERLLTDCLSCRLQFHQLLPYEVSHPIEILSEAYKNCEQGAHPRGDVTEAC